MKMFEKLKKIIKNMLNFENIDLIDDIVCYICGNEALPLPLEADEELMLIEELSKDNQTAKEKLVEHNLRLVAHIIKKYYTNH